MVADISAVDTLGLPVFISERLHGEPVRLHAGKGLLAEDAEVGAWMEALEHAVSESCSAGEQVVMVPLAQLQAAWPAGLTPDDFAPRLGVSMHSSALVGALPCERLLLDKRGQLAGDGPYLLPAETLLLPAAPHQLGVALFGASSCGLASGNSLSEATLHALLEVLEHDAVAMNQARDSSRHVVSLPAPYPAWAQRWARRGVALRVRQLPSDCGLACFEATLLQADAPPHAAVAHGRGAHLDRNVALARAVCEAAQSRAVALLASRPGMAGADAAAQRLGEPPSPTLLRRAAERARRHHPQVRFDAVPHRPANSVAHGLRTLLRQLDAVGIGPVFRRRLGDDHDAWCQQGLEVVRVVVAGCEPCVGVHPRVGRRQRSRLLGE